MTRHRYGGGADDYAYADVDSVDGENDLVQLLSAITITFWNAETAGTPYTDLLDENGTPTDHIVTSDGTDGRTVGRIPPFQGPDEVWEMWASADGGPRNLMVATDTGTTLGPVVTSTQALLTSHIAAPNPHQTTVADLFDVDSALALAVIDGQMLGYSSALLKWVPLTVPGVSNVVTLTGTQTITGLKNFTPPTTGDSAIRITANPSQTGDLLVCFNSDGERTGYHNEKGELRSIAAAANSVPLRVKGKTGQTAALTEWTDIDNNVLASVDAVGRVRAPNMSVLPPVTVSGVLAVGGSQALFYNDTGVSLTLRSVRASVSTAPTGASILVDININGVTIFTTQANRPAIAAAGTTSGAVTAINVATIPAGAVLSIDVDQIGSGTPGSNLVVQLLAY